MNETIIEEAIEINARPQVVWLVFSDARKWPEWNPVFATLLTEDESEPWRPGGSFTLQVAADNRTFDLHVNVVDAEPGRRVRWRTKERGVTGEFELLIEAANGSTRVVAKQSFRGIFLSLVRLTAAPQDVEKFLRVWLDSLKRESERRAQELRRAI